MQTYFLRSHARRLFCSVSKVTYIVSDMISVKLMTELWECLRGYGVSGKFLVMLQALYIP